MSKAAIFGSAVVLLAAGVLTLVTAGSRFLRDKNVESDPPLRTEVIARESVPADEQLEQEIVEEFELIAQNGKPFHSKELAGDVHVVNFFFASCPSYCRMQSTEVQKLAKEFGPRGVKFLSITCDPENDTPAALAKYASLFNADPEDWLFLTGDLLLIRRVGAEMYQLPVDKQSHSERLVVVDGSGEIQGSYRWRNHPEDLAAMRAKLAELLEGGQSLDTPPAGKGDETASAGGAVAGEASPDEEPLDGATSGGSDAGAGAASSGQSEEDADPARGVGG